MKRKASKRRVDVDGSASASLNKISELPQVLLQNILYFLSPKQAAQTILLSKAWQNTWPSNNRPNIDLDEDSFLGTSDEFLSLVHNTLQGYHEHKLRINAFRLGLSELNSESVSLLEEWIPIVIHMGVKMFHLHITDTTSDTYYYNLPRAVFEAESIIELSLHGSRLDYDDDKVIMFKHLKVLKLSQVYIEEKTLQRIISSCPLIEDMELLECEGLRSITLNNLQNLKEFYFMCYACLRIEGGEEEGDICPSIEWAGVANLKSITICGHANWFHLDNFQVFPNLKDLSLINVCLSGISSLCDDFWCYFPGLENLKFNNCYGLEEIQISSHSIQHISLTDINRSIKARFDAPNILSFEYSGKYIPATLSFAKSYSKWKSDIVLELDIVDDDSLWLKQLNEMLRGGLSQSKITLDLYKLPNHQQNNNNNNNIVHNFEPVEVELKFSFQKKQKNSSTTVVMNDLFRVCRPKNVDVCWYAKEDSKYERKSNEYAEEVFKILMERSQSISTEIINQDYNSPSPFTQLIGKMI